MLVQGVGFQPEGSTAAAHRRTASLGVLRRHRRTAPGPAVWKRSPPAHWLRPCLTALTRPRAAAQLGTHLRAKNKREDMAQALRKMRCVAPLRASRSLDAPRAPCIIARVLTRFPGSWLQCCGN